MSNAITPYYPTIINSDGTESDANFITDYLHEYTIFDNYLKFQHGNKFYDNDSISASSIYPEWIEEANSIVAIHLDSWARIYHSLSLQWNPLFNVDGTEKEIHSDVVRESDYAADKTTNAYGMDKTTNAYGQDKSTSAYGQDKSTNAYGSDKTTSVIADRDNDNTNYAMAYDSNSEHETSRTAATVGGGTDTSTRDARTDTSTRDARTDTVTKDAKTDTSTRDSHTDTSTRDARKDTETTKEHSITHIRQGNIGVTKTTELLSDTWKFYQNNFFKMVIDTIIMESGCDYE